MYCRVVIYCRRYLHTIIFGLKLEAGVALSVDIGAFFVCCIYLRFSAMKVCTACLSTNNKIVP